VSRLRQVIKWKDITASALRQRSGLLAIDESREQQRPKTFVVGLNKTGTTSLAEMARMAGLRVGDQGVAERLADHAIRTSNWMPLINFCKSADFFQDVPFSFPGAYQLFDLMFPNSRFILTERNSSDEWVTSLIRYHSLICGTKDRPPNASDLLALRHISKGWLYRIHRFQYGVSEDALYDKGQLTRVYDTHKRNVESHFISEQSRFAVVNVARNETLRELDRVAPEISANVAEFPHLNSLSKPVGFGKNRT